MTAVARPRIVVVTRRSPLDELLDRHGTAGQVRFHLESRGESIAPLEVAHARVEAGVARVIDALDVDRRRVRIDRGDLDRFVFGADDVIVVVGQDGLVANVSKYLDGQPLIGVNPDPTRIDGVLCRHGPGDVAAALRWIDTRSGPFAIERRTMVEAETDDGVRIRALNELFVGHRSHQSARYRLRIDGREERQSSSGVIIATGTGSTGWARSIVEQRRLSVDLPTPDSPALAWFVREPFPSVTTQTAMDHGLVAAAGCIEIVSEIERGGVLFGDGIEGDALDFPTGATIRARAARTTLGLVVRAPSRANQRAGAKPKRARRAGSPTVAANSAAASLASVRATSS